MERKIFWKTQLFLSLVFFCSTLTAAFVHAQEDYPNRPITFIVGYPAGGAADLTSRVLTELAGKRLGQPIAVLNKPGASSSVALSGLMAEKPDGYTIGIIPSAAVLISLMQKVPYDATKDFTPIIQYAAFEIGLAVKSDSPWKNFKEFIHYAKENPNKIRYASAGAGTPTNLLLERLAIDHGIKWLHLPYDGDTPAVIALLGGHVDAAAASSGGWKPHVDAGRLRVLATFLEKRSNAVRDVPTLIDLGYNMTGSSLIGIAGPKGMTEKVVGKLHEAFKKSMEDPMFIQTAERLGVPIYYRSPQELKQYIEKIVKEDGEMIQKLGLKKY